MYFDIINKYRASSTTSLFSEEYRLDKLTTQGDPTRAIEQSSGMGIFSGNYRKIHKKKMVNAGPKPYDPVLMFKILILQRYYNLSDSQIEYRILDRLTFCRFLGLSLNDKVPDEKTVWGFRDKSIRKGLEKELFEKFTLLLESHGLIAHEGKIIDASFV